MYYDDKIEDNLDSRELTYCVNYMVDLNAACILRTDEVEAGHTDFAALGWAVAEDPETVAVESGAAGHAELQGSLYYEDRVQDHVHGGESKH